MHISRQEKKFGSGEWHQICFVWESSAGSWKLYQDGQKTGDGNDLAKDHVIVPGGSLVLAQEQDNVGGGFKSNQAFVGELSDVNMWYEELSGKDISRMSKKCRSEEGNVFEWSDFKSDVRGNAEVVQPSSCK